MRMPLFCDNIEVNFTIRTLLGDVKETRSKEVSLSDLIPLLTEQENNEEN